MNEIAYDDVIALLDELTTTITADEEDLAALNLTIELLISLEN